MGFKRFMSFGLACLLMSVVALPSRPVSADQVAGASLSVVCLGKGDKAPAKSSDDVEFQKGDTLWIGVNVDNSKAKSAFLSGGITSAEVAFDYCSKYLEPHEWEKEKSECETTNRSLWTGTDYKFVFTPEAIVSGIQQDAEREYKASNIAENKLAVVSVVATGASARAFTKNNDYLFKVPFKLKQDLPAGCTKILQLALSPETFSMKSKTSGGGEWARSVDYNFGGNINLKGKVFDTKVFGELFVGSKSGEVSLVISESNVNSKALAGEAIDATAYQVLLVSSGGENRVLQPDEYEFCINGKKANTYPADGSRTFELSAVLADGTISNALSVELWNYQLMPAIPILVRCRVHNSVEIANETPQDSVCEILYAVLPSGTEAAKLPSDAWKSAEDIHIETGEVVVAKALGSAEQRLVDSKPTSVSNKAPNPYTAYIDVQGKIAGASLGKYFVNPKEEINSASIHSALKLEGNLFSDRYMAKGSKIDGPYVVPSVDDMKIGDNPKLPYVQLWNLEKFSINKELLSKYVAGYEVKPGEFEFRAANGMNRAEFAVLMSRVLTVPMQNQAARQYAPDMVFADEDSIPAWAKQNVKFLVELGVVGGYDEGGQKYFKPFNVLTRAELVKIIAAVESIAELNDDEIKQLIARDAEADFKDVDGHWAARYVYALKDKGVVGGYKEGAQSLFRPNKSITRAEVVTIIDRILLAKNLVSNVKPVDLDESFWAYSQIVRAMNERSI